MLAALRYLVIFSLLAGGLSCPSQTLMAAATGQFGHDEANQVMLQASVGLRPCCLDGHRADSPIFWSDLQVEAISSALPVLVPLGDDDGLDSGGLDQPQKYRDKFEEGNRHKRE